MRAFLEQLIDYAGLFPPAQLPLAEAVGKYLEYRRGADAWMLGRFVCPAARLGELAEFRADFERTPITLSVLARGGQDAKELFDNVRKDLADIQAVEKGFGKAAVAEAYEVKLPAGVLERANQLSAVVGTVAYLIETSGVTGMAPFFESPSVELPAVQALTRVLGDEKNAPDARNRQRCGPAGWKLRCGGLEAAAFPTARQVALVLAACCAARIPWKATAGLHHPLRHFDAQLNSKMHGFVNVFGAGVVGHANLIDEVQMEAMILDEDASHFRLDEAGLAWKEFRASPEQVRMARQKLVTSFGSCSFDEPRDNMRNLGWMG